MRGNDIPTLTFLKSKMKPKYCRTTAQNPPAPPCGLWFFGGIL